jgi:hypothetical protein
MTKTKGSASEMTNSLINSSGLTDKWTEANKAEFDRDLMLLKKIFYDTLQRSINFQRDVKTLSAASKKERNLLEAMLKAVDVQKLVFFSPTEIIDKCLDPNQGISLAKIRELRKTLMKLVMNIDNVIYRFFIDNPTILRKQIELTLHIFDGIGRVSREEKNKLRLLRKTIRGVKIAPVSTALMVESLSKGRIFCMFFVKWLTSTDNDYTDQNIANADYSIKRDFSIHFSQNFNRLSRTEMEANVAFLVDKVNVIEQKLDTLSKESTSAHVRIADEILAIKEVCLKIAERDPEEILKFIQSNSEELKRILSTIEKNLSSFDSAKARAASNWKNRVEHGISITADVIALINFLLGVTSIPAFVDLQTLRSIMNLFRSLAQRVSI